jgi:pyrroline-5-carboxylate reductase
MPPPLSLSSLNRLLVVGGGNMSHATLSGLTTRAGGLDPARVMVLDPSQDARSRLLNDFGVGVGASPSDLPPDFRRPDAMLWVVKPQMFREVANGLMAGGVDTSHTLNLSVMAGVPVSTLQRTLGARDDHRIVRAMPNTPAGVGEGMTALYASSRMTPEHRALASALMGAVGQTTWVAEEHLIDAATALSGSGPGYLAEMADTMVKVGVELGLTREQARQMVAQTFKGTGAWMAASPEKPLSEMVNEVSSPGGTTWAARDTLHAQGVHDGLRAGVHAAYARSMELGGSGPAAAAAAAMDKTSATAKFGSRPSYGPAH